MKKVIFTIFAVLLVSFLITCDLFQLPPDTEEAPPDFTEDGRPMAHLTIGVRNDGVSRALIAGDAPGRSNFYEVVFKDPYDPDKFYQIDFDNTATSTPALRTITIPVGDYTGDTKAVLFAGKGDGTDKILLGIGYITQVDSKELALRTDGHAGTAYIDSGNHSVTFTITALTGNSSSTFEILGPKEAYGTDDYSAASPGTVPVVGIDYPTFPIPGEGYSSSDGTYTYSSSSASDYLDENIVGRYTVDLTNHSAAVILTAPWTAVANSWGGATGVNGLVECHAFSTGGIEGSELSIESDVCKFDFVVDVSGLNTSGDGLCSVLIDAPVRALAPMSGSTYQIGSPVPWHIRAGTDNNTPDGASTGTNYGALIILDVGGSLSP